MPTSTSETGGSRTPRPPERNSSRHWSSEAAPPTAVGRQDSPLSSSDVFLGRPAAAGAVDPVSVVAAGGADALLFGQEHACGVDAAEVQAQVARPASGDSEARVGVPLWLEAVVNHAGGAGEAGAV